MSHPSQLEVSLVREPPLPRPLSRARERGETVGAIQVRPLPCAGEGSQVESLVVFVALSRPACERGQTGSRLRRCSPSLSRAQERDPGGDYGITLDAPSPVRGRGVGGEGRRQADDGRPHLGQRYRASQVPCARRPGGHHGPPQSTASRFIAATEALRKPCPMGTVGPRIQASCRGRVQPGGYVLNRAVGTGFPP